MPADEENIEILLSYIKHGSSDTTKTTENNPFVLQKFWIWYQNSYWIPEKMTCFFASTTSTCAGLILFLPTTRALFSSNWLGLHFGYAFSEKFPRIVHFFGPIATVRDNHLYWEQEITKIRSANFHWFKKNMLNLYFTRSLIKITNRKAENRVIYPSLVNNINCMLYMLIILNVCYIC
jgi:hypothetical protein